MVSPRWVETYRPSLKAFIEAGVLYEDGEYEAAREAFAGIEEDQAAAAMENACAVKLAAEALRRGDAEAARSLLETVDAALLPLDTGTEYASLLAALPSPDGGGE